MLIATLIAQYNMNQHTGYEVINSAPTNPLLGSAYIGKQIFSKERNNSL